MNFIVPDDCLNPAYRFECEMYSFYTTRKAQFEKSLLLYPGGGGVLSGKVGTGHTGGRIGVVYSYWPPL